MTDREAILAVAGELRRAQRIGIAGHVGPDGDSLGTSLALAIAARGAGKEAVASFGEPFVVPAAFRFLPQHVLVAPGAFPADPDLVVAVDVGAPDRLGSLAPVAAAGRLVVIDHHRSNAGFGDVAYIDPDAAASAQMVYYLLEELGWSIDAEVATCLYTGLVTDTGRFQYSSTTPEVHRIAGRLIAAGAVPTEVSRFIYEETPFGYLELAGVVMGRAQFEPDAALVWSTVYIDDLRSAGLGYEDADGLINEIRVTAGAEVALLLKETDGGTKASLRSRGAVDVGSLARTLGGGGHHNSAGFNRSDPPEVVVELVRAELSA
jgi:phosphoesterase RecJ-like protein